MAMSTWAPTATFAKIRTAVEDLIPLIESEAPVAERANHLTAPVVAGLREAGIFSMMVPRALGGPELPLLEGMQIIERLSWADGSTGWCAAVGGVTAANTAAFLPDGGARAIFGTGPNVPITSSGTPRGAGRRVDGGFMFSGTWGYGSGIEHAKWVSSMCMVMEDGKPKIGPHGAPEFFMAHHHRDTVEFKGNWDVLGLRGTSSFDYTLKDGERFVPDELCFPADGPPQLRGGLQYSIGIVGFAPWGHTAWALGVGRRVLDELKRVANARTDAFGLLAESAMFQRSFAEVETKYRAARAFVYESWQSIAESVARGERATHEQIALVRLGMRHSHDVASEIATFAHKAARGASLRAGTMQRVYRDIHSGTQHLTLADEIERDCGRVLLGRAEPEATRWTLLGLRG